MLFRADIGSGESQIFRLRLAKAVQPAEFEDFNRIIDQSLREADDFYAAIQSPVLHAEGKQLNIDNTSRNRYFFLYS